MPFLFNVHAPSKTFAIQQKDGEKHSGLIARIASKAGLSRQEATSLQEGKDGSGVVYEYEGSRWSLEDDDDLEIFLSRFPPSSTSSATFHLTPPHAHAHFSMPESPAKNSAASALKDKTKSPVKSKSTKSKSSEAGYKLKDFAAGEVKPAGKTGRELGPVAEVKSNGNGDVEGEAKGHHFPQSSHSGNHKREDISQGRQELNEQDKKDVQGGQGGHKKEISADSGNSGESGEKKGGGLEVPGGGWKFRKNWAPSIRSAKSHRSKWGDDDAEPLWEVKKREWLEFQNGSGNGVRTVMGSVGDAKNVRMLLKPGHKGVYISRSFAVKNNLVPKTFAMGAKGYTGLKSIGLVPITVAGKTHKHNTLICEEEHFDVVLGRTWMEKMNIKVDPIDQTKLTYMENGNTIPCDIVVLKDKQGNAITIT